MNLAVPTSPVRVTAWQSLVVTRRATLSLNEWAVLTLLVDSPRHGYDIAAELAPGRPLGDVWRVRRPLVYRALERLADLGMATTDRTEKGDAAPPRTIYRPTRQGRDALVEWLTTPASHLRDVRSELLLKLVAHEVLGADPRPLVAAQRAAFAPLLAGLGPEPPPGDVIATWRHHSARAVDAFLAALEGSPP